MRFLDGRVAKLAAGILRDVPSMRHLPHRTIPKTKPSTHNVVSANHHTVSPILGWGETEVVIMLYGHTVRSLSFHAVAGGVKSHRV